MLSLKPKDLPDWLPPGHQRPAPEAPGLFLHQSEPSDAVLVAGFANQEAACCAALSASLKVDGLGACRGHVSDEGLWVLWAGPGQWLVLAPAATQLPEGTLMERLSGDVLAGKAALIDQSDMRVSLTLHGAQTLSVLRRLVNLDVSPEVFLPGSVALTPIAEVPGVLFRDPVHSDRHHLLLPRSYGASTLEMVAILARRHGVRVEGGATKAADRPALTHFHDAQTAPPHGG